MVRTRSVLVVTLGLALGMTACKKDKTDAPAAADKATDKGATPGDKSAPAAVAGITGAVGDDLSLLPVDSEMVIGINFGQLQGSALWKELVAPKLAKADLAPIQKFKTLCGFDPLESLKSVAIGMKNLGPGNDPQGAIVVHGYDKSKSMTCFDKDGVSEIEKDGSKVTIDGDVAIIKDKSGKQFGFTFVNDTTAIGIIGPDASSVDTIKKAAGGGGALRTSAAFVEMYQKIASNESLWMVINGSAPAFSKAAAMGVKFKALYGSLNITDGLTVDMRMRFATPDEATQFVTMSKGQINNPQVKAMFDKLDITNDGSDAKFALAMSAEKLKALVAMVGGMMGGMMGAGGAH